MPICTQSLPSWGSSGSVLGIVTATHWSSPSWPSAQSGTTAPRPTWPAARRRKLRAQRSNRTRQASRRRRRCNGPRHSPAARAAAARGVAAKEAAARAA
eukprot:scaffold74698_cov60-Phaeocystis_antarctica.AAC.1